MTTCEMAPNQKYHHNITDIAGIPPNFKSLLWMIKLQYF